MPNTPHTPQPLDQQARDTIIAGGQQLNDTIATKVQDWMTFATITKPDIGEYTTEEKQLVTLGAQLGLMMFAEMFDAGQLSIVRLEQVKAISEYMKQRKQQQDDN